MRTRLVSSLFIALLFIATNAAAQASVGLDLAGLVSIQPIDESWVGSPYLDKGLGGVGPGLSGGIHAAMANGFTFGAEFSTAFFSEEQQGRLISGPREGVIETHTLHDAMVAGVAGYSHADGNTGIRYLFGAGALLSDGEKVEKTFVPTGGIDVLQRVSPRISLLFTGRYAYVSRTSNGTALAAGSHIIRAGAGVRIKLN